MKNKYIINPKRPPGCTVAFSTGTASENGETLVMKNGDIDSHWYMQMQLSRKCSYRKDDFYSGPLSRYSDKKRHKFVGQRCMSYWAPHMGINDAQVSISLLASPGREDEKKAGLLGGFDYNLIVLELADSAAAAVDILGDAVERFGFSDISMSYVIGDPLEVWVFEASGFKWAAKRINDDIGSHANNYLIEEDWDRAAVDLVDYAQKKGWLKKGETFNFREVYSGSGYLHQREAPLVDIFSSTVRQERAGQLLKSCRKKGPVSIDQMMELSRDQLDTFELKNGERLDFNQTPWHSTEFYRDDYGGGEWLDEYPENDHLKSPVFIRQICCDTVYEKTLGAAVFVSGDRLEETGLMYSLTGVPTFSAFTPFFAGVSLVHPAFSGIKAAKLFESIDLQAFGKYQEFHPISESILRPLENDFIAETDKIFRAGSEKLDFDLLETFSIDCSEKLMNAGNRIIEQFQLHDLKLRSWGRERKSSNRHPDIYTIIDELVVTGSIACERSVPLAIVKNGMLMIDVKSTKRYLSGAELGSPFEEPLYEKIEDAAISLGFDWEDVPATGDLYIFKK